LETFNYSGSPLDPEYLLRSPAVDQIKNQITLIENPDNGSFVKYPVKLDVVVCIICMKGIFRGSLNLKKFEAEAPCLFISVSGQILQCDDFSENFKGSAIILLKGFWDGFTLDNSLTFPLSSSIRDNPTIRLNAEELNSMTDYFRLLQKTIRKTENQNRPEAAKYLTLAFFHGFGYQFHQIPDETNKSKQDKLVEKFLTLVKENYKKHRIVEFYADKLCLTPKYLSKVVKQNSNKTAADWVEDHVILEAKALLKSTDKTIGQISEELNFPTQSFFGKYFKRRTGLPPKDYRKTR